MRQMIKNNLKIASAILSIVAFVSFAPEMAAQQDSQYTQYMYNTQTVNPAYVGSRGVFGITGLYRNQWVGLDGAPETLNVSLNTPVGSSERLGLGVSFVEDRIGPAEES
ncbi:MAG: PorP/SprF family type IX secretion system membrane protein, partial [Marinirhabdus sp.]